MQNDGETVTRHYIVDYLSIANRDIFVTEDGSYTTRYVYDAGGRRISAEFDYAEGTHRGEAGENLQSDIAVSIGKVFYRTSILGSTLFAVDRNGNLIAHAIYDPWGKPLTETYADSNYSGLENLNNYTGYTYDVTLALYFAQNRFYDADTHRFTQEDWAKSGVNWYVYCGNEPMLHIDFNGLMPVWLLQALASAYISGLIPDRYIGSIVILANMVYRSQDFVDKAKELSTNLLTILDIFRELDGEVKDNSPNRQAIFLSFHEIAQIVAAKQILNTYGIPPELEKITADYKEMDISLGDYVWEVKPGYAAYSSFLNSINKYVNEYSRTKLQTEYTTDNGLHIPGGFVPTKTIKLFSIYNINVMMSVVYQGPGRIGYFFQIKCKEKNVHAEIKAKDVASILLPVFEAVDDVEKTGEIVIMLVALVASIIDGAPGDEIAVGAMLEELIEQFAASPSLS